MANNSSQSNGDIPFSVDINDYSDTDAVAFGTTIHKLGRFKDAVKSMCQNSLYQHIDTEFERALGVKIFKWLDPGTDCEILKASGKGWKKGKIKCEITVKFYPDEPDEQELPTSTISKKSIRLNQLSMIFVSPWTN